MSKNTVGYIAFEGFEESLKAELKYLEVAYETHGDLFLVSERPSRDPFFAKLVLNDLIRFKVASIKDAAKKIRAESKKPTYAHSMGLHRRCALIAEDLRKVRIKSKIEFLEALPTAPLALFTLLSQDEVLLARTTSSVFPDASFEFNEDKDIPPNRAYLKLWEVFTLFPETRPPKGSTVIDCGASPGGWSWVLSQLGCKVIAIDRAPLSPKIFKVIPHGASIKVIQKDIFKLDLEEFENVSHIFWDVICYPEKLLEVVSALRAQNEKLKFVCSIKFKGNPDFKVCEQFLTIPGSRIVHLHQNKNEVTWICGS